MLSTDDDPALHAPGTSSVCSKVGHGRRPDNRSTLAPEQAMERRSLSGCWTLGGGAR